MPHSDPYRAFLRSASAAQWKRIKPRRRAAVATPLFSIHSKRSVGVGEIPDLVALADWCRACGIGIIQLLPLNDVGFTFTPYDAESAFALEPMYLSIEAIGPAAKPFAKELERLRLQFPRGGAFHRPVKQAKLDILRKIYHAGFSGRHPRFERFRKAHSAWLEPYTAFKVLKERFGGAAWEAWPDEYRDARTGFVRAAEEEADRMRFHAWLQWQLCEQMSAAREACASRGVLLMGDLPFLVSRDSADVWASPLLFKLDLAAGAPPDLCFAKGQKWGMPPYAWERIAADGYRMLGAKLRYAERFYDLFRIDHFVGFFRLWSIPLGEEGDRGFFEPADERTWEEHGRRILDVILANTGMLPCAEDLGTVPECSYKVLSEYALPGMDVQRWTKTGWDHFDFKAPGEYRANSIATASTHDVTPLAAWWEFEAGTVDEVAVRRRCADHGLSFPAVSARLFDPARSAAHGRLRWRNQLRDFRALPALLERPEHEVGDWIDLFRSTFDEREKFWRYAGLAGEPERTASPRLIAAALGALAETRSVFTSQLLQDLLALGPVAPSGEALWDFRINFPGTTGPKNWALVMPVGLEEMMELPLNRTLLELHRRTGRA